MRVVAINMEWSPLPSALAHLHQPILNKLNAWLGTGYRSGQRCRGVDADCLGFACGAVDNVDGRRRAVSPLLPPDTAFHNPKAAIEAVRTVRELYSPAERVLPDEDGKVRAQPMDFLVVSTGAGGPGHMMLVGPEKNTLWHCIQFSGVAKIGWSLFEGYERVFALYRLGDRHRWLN